MKGKKKKEVVKKPAYLTIKLGADRYIKMQKRTFILSILIIGFFAYMILSFGFTCNQKTGLSCYSRPAKIKKTR